MFSAGQTPSYGSRCSSGFGSLIFFVAKLESLGQVLNEVREVLSPATAGAEVLRGTDANEGRGVASNQGEMPRPKLGALEAGKSSCS